MTERLVVIGNGMASGRMLEHLLQIAPGRYQITLFGAEPRVNYNRIMLSPVLSGEKTFDEIVTHPESWYVDNGITLLRGKEVTAIDRARKMVSTADGLIAPYDRLVIATGSTPFIIPVPGKDLPGVVAYRDLGDVETMLEVAAKGGRAVVIGGGLLGLEAAAGLKMRGMEVTVLHIAPTLMERQLDPAAGQLLKEEMERRRIEVVTSANTKEIIGEKRVEAIRLDDGRIIPCDLVVMAVGIRPSTALGKAADLDVVRGIVVDDRMVTSDRHILAVGECAEHRGQCYGLVAPLYEMAKVAAATLAGEDAAYLGSVTSTKLKVTGVDLFSAGDFAEAPDREEIVFRDAGGGVYKRIVLRENRIIGAVLYGETTDGGYFFDLLCRHADIAADRDTLIFGRSFAGGPPLDPTAAVAVSRGDKRVPGCNGLSQHLVARVAA
jgi:nitrite reductase (NADH) large subunit